MKNGITASASYNTQSEMPYRGPGEPLPLVVKEDPTLTAVPAFMPA